MPPLVVLAALLNALRIVKKDLKKLRVVVTGVGAAGTATIKILLSSGVKDIVGVDEFGAIHKRRTQGMDFMKRWVAAATNPRQLTGRLAEVVERADVFIGLSVFTFDYAEGTSYFSTDPKACVNCHIMNDQYHSWQKGGHHASATCVECHLPHDTIPKYIAKADHGFWHSKGFTFNDFKEPIRIKARSAVGAP